MITVDPNKTKEIDRGIAKSTRDAALAGMTHDFLDGRVMQVRAEDLGNIQIAIADGADLEWVMEDNTPHMVTVVELQTALADGIAQGKAIWQTYMDSLKTL